ncbi:hypothetical protein [Mangrovicoccus ximenensis]|uniref:hypothetical protein n=1 Tax=Mangrovicoccus ximenensis TaxID=1911570 RepID=UPI000D36DC77|nr:hypothetical protein [Mangrovicoccus ximenensis]
MLRLASLLCGLIVPTLAGTGAVIALAAGTKGAAAILSAAAAGTLAALPLSRVAAKALYGS